jgi:polar amino acid transport system permease protein
VTRGSLSKASKHDPSMTWLHFIPALLKGAEVTAVIAVASTALGGVMAFIIGVARVEGGPIISKLALVYIEFMRGVPLLVKFFWLYYALPLIGLSLDPITTGVVGLVFNISAYGAEVVRGGLQSVPDQQHEAARALNFSKAYTLIHISLPQALVEMMPAFGNLAIQNLKDTALVSLISIADLTFQAQQLRNITLDSTRVFTLTLIGYFIMALALALVMRAIEHKLRRGSAFPRVAS